MNFNKVFKSTLSAACIASMAVMGTSCIDYNDNVNPNEVTDDMMAQDNLRTGAFFRQMLRRIVLVRDGDLIVDSDYQIAQNLTHDAYAGYATQTLGNAGNHNQYSWNNQWVRSTYNFAYTGIMSAWNQLAQVAEQNGQAEIKALADVVKVLGMHRIADSYGPLNYVTFGVDGNFNSLEDVYKKFFDELDSAIDVLTPYANTGSKLMSDYDLVYQGDVTSWVKLANTLRLRLALRVAYANEALAREEATKSINHPLGFVDSKGNLAKLSGHYHSIVTIAYEFGDGPSGSGGDCVPSASIVSYMANMKDGRISKYFKPCADGEYHGIRIGYNIANVSPVRAAASKFYMDEKNDTKAPVVFVHAAESFFLRAEAALRWNIGGDAASLYEQGVRASFDEVDATGADAYLAVTATPGAYADPTTLGNDYTFKTNVTPKWDNAADFEGKLERIITQKWIAIYPDGCEGWAEYRRTGYPELIPVVTNNSNGTIDTNLQVRRMPFPDTEYTNNPSGVAAGVAALGGPDNGGTKLWWDKKAR